jgi:hypothetical protein
MKEKDTVEMVIGIQIRDTKILLSEEDAKALYAKLHEMFGKKVEVQKEYVYNPWVVPNYPTYPPISPIWVTPINPPWKYDIWCGATSGSSNTCIINTTSKTTGSSITYKL